MPRALAAPSQPPQLYTLLILAKRMTSYTPRPYLSQSDMQRLSRPSRIIHENLQTRCTMMNCPTCHEEIFPDATLCRFCGAVLPGSEPAVAFTNDVNSCPACQEQLPPQANYCPHCGMVAQAPATGVTTRLSEQARLGRPTTQPLLRSCPKCQGTMEHGFIPEHIQGRRDILVWINGDAERSRWNNSVTITDRSMWGIRSYRCAMCEYVELYAIDQRE